MRLTYCITALIIFITPTFGAQKVLIPQRTVPGLKISYPNTALIESIVRQKISTRADTDEIIIKMKCYKRWKVRGRSNTKAYQCEPIEIEADVPDL
jgi:hypothetical protein